MRKMVLALMDSEESYAVRFMEHMNRKKTMPFEVHAFTDKEKLLEYVTAHHVEILLISEHDLEEGCEYPAGQIIVLTDRSSGNGLFPNVCKYQSSSQVMREVMEVYGRQCGGIEIDRGVIIKPPMKIAGVFSPVARCGKTSFALALGQNLARVKPTLYLNFEAGSGMKVLLNGSWERDLSDIIYYIRRGEKNIAARLLPLIRELGQMGYVPPCSAPSEIYNVEEDEWRRMFESLRRDSSYEMLVLDLGSLPLFMPEILEECDVIYMPLRGDEVARAKLKEYEEALKEHDVEIASRTHHLQIPLVKTSQNTTHYAERLPYGPVGRCAEEWISKDRL